MKTSSQDIWAEYNRLKGENASTDLYDTVKKNENFFIGKQWEGVNAPRGMEKPVFNILKRVVSYFVSLIVSDDVAANVSLFGRSGDSKTDEFLHIVSEQIEETFENTKIKAKNRDAIRNAAVDGDACFYMSFNPDVEIGQDAKGMIDIELIDNTNILFGNPQVWDIQKQPYVIIVSRRTIDSVREEAKERGLRQSEINAIQPDEWEDNDEENGKVTVLTKLFKKGKTIHLIKTTANITLQKDTDLGYQLYPVAWFSWDKVKNSYHGQAAVTGLIPNQIFINKLFAMSMEHVRNMAFPKVIYNQRMIPEGWNNDVGAAIGVNGEPNMAIATGFRAPDMSNQVLVLIDTVIQYTRDTMGASDAALGNVRPDNTSAIIAVQKASAMPLELQRMAFYQFVEDYVRIFIDIMRVDYGIRNVATVDEKGNITTAPIDFSQLNDMNLKLNVEVGASTYWSELMQVQTIDNLFSMGIITDAITYLESVPDGYIHNKQKLINKIKEQQDVMNQAATAQLGLGDASMAAMPSGGGNEADLLAMLGNMPVQGRGAAMPMAGGQMPIM